MPILDDLSYGEYVKLYCSEKIYMITYDSGCGIVLRFSRI